MRVRVFIRAIIRVFIRVCVRAFFLRALYSNTVHEKCSERVCFFVLCKRHWFNRVPGAHRGDSLCIPLALTLTLRDCAPRRMIESSLSHARALFPKHHAS